jgi:hypothetical protein
MFGPAGTRNDNDKSKRRQGEPKRLIPESGTV